MKTENNYFAKAEMLIRKPITEVFQAFVDPDITSKFWFTKGSGRLQEGETTKWTWEMYGFTLMVTTHLLQENHKIEIEWGTAEEATIVQWTFTSLNENETFVSIINSGLKGEPDKIIDQVRNSTEGFTLVLAGAKAYLEHAIQLNLVLDRFPKGLA